MSRSNPPLTVGEAKAMIKAHVEKRMAETREVHEKHINKIQGKVQHKSPAGKSPSISIPVRNSSNWPKKRPLVFESQQLELSKPSGQSINFEEENDSDNDNNESELREEIHRLKKHLKQSQLEHGIAAERVIDLEEDLDNVKYCNRQLEIEASSLTVAHDSILEELNALKTTISSVDRLRNFKTVEKWGNRTVTIVDPEDINYDDINNDDDMEEIDEDDEEEQFSFLE